MNLTENLNKFSLYALYVLGIMSLINGCNGCRTSSEVKKMRHEVDSMRVEISDTRNAVRAQYYTKDQLDTRLEILALEEEKSVLFNVNYIVLTKQRPDIRMNEIDQKIKELKTHLK